MVEGIPFLKMNGLGNDFVVLDGRTAPVRLSRSQIARISDRDAGIGCDQLIVMQRPDAEADVFMRIYNGEGTEVEACGNATRCIAHLLMSETGKDRVLIETVAGTLAAEPGGEGLITVDMGVPRLEWHEIPLAEKFHDTRAIELQIGPIDAPVLHSPAVVNIGNPHAVFFVDDVEAYDLSRIGPMLEHHPIFPQQANISLAQILDRQRIRVRVWERGAGATRACGSAACAVAVAACRKRLADRRCQVLLPGGPLLIEWREDDGHVLMTGPYTLDFTGVLAPELLAGNAA